MKEINPTEGTDVVQLDLELDPAHRYACGLLTPKADPCLARMSPDE